MNLQVKTRVPSICVSFKILLVATFLNDTAKYRYFFKSGHEIKFTSFLLLKIDSYSGQDKTLKWFEYSIVILIEVFKLCSSKRIICLHGIFFFVTLITFCCFFTVKLTGFIKTNISFNLTVYIYVPLIGKMKSVHLKNQLSRP